MDDHGDGGDFGGMAECPGSSWGTGMAFDFSAFNGGFGRGSAEGAGYASGMGSGSGLELIETDSGRGWGYGG